MTNGKGKQNRTPSAARAALDSQGISVAEFARKHDLPYGTVYQVLTGQKKGRRGAAHRAAVLLGIKSGVVENAKGESADGSL